MGRHVAMSKATMCHGINSYKNYGPVPKVNKGPRSIKDSGRRKYGTWLGV